METRTYLITAATGIGAETARLLARSTTEQASINILVSTLDPRHGDELCEELRALGTAAAFLAGNLTDPVFATSLIAHCVHTFGSLDGLFNVAGISGRRYGDGPVHECTEEAWAITLDTNLTTQYRVSREAVRQMLRQPERSNGVRGVILNMASVLGVDPEPTHFDTVAYAASKGAILAMTRSMAASYARSKIRVNAIAPGLTKTAMSARAVDSPEVLDFIREKQPLTGEVLSAHQVASACAYLLGDSASAITGQTLIVDAGWSLF